jgi:hypothetical protein
LNNLTNPKGLGPVGMHENLGGLTVAIILNSRREDLGSGGANILVLYPKDEVEATDFAGIKTTRLKQPPGVIEQDNHYFFLDIPPTTP